MCTFQGETRKGTEKVPMTTASWQHDIHHGKSHNQSQGHTFVRQ